MWAYQTISYSERILSLNPNDNQGVRFCWHDVRHGRSWDEIEQREEPGAAPVSPGDRP
jgi:hypothetical protein